MINQSMHTQAATARVAVEAKVPRYLLVSSAFVARPFHPIALMLSAYVRPPLFIRGLLSARLLDQRVFLTITILPLLNPNFPPSPHFTSFFGKVMQWKRKGELAAIAAIRGSHGQTSYTVVRPGGLNDKKPAVGLAGLRISQGDVVGGLITRDDTARVCVEALKSEAARDAVLEIVTWGEGKGPATVPRDWPAFFSKLRPNDGAHAPGFYPDEEAAVAVAAAGAGVGGGEQGPQAEGQAEPATSKTEL